MKKILVLLFLSVLLLPISVSAETTTIDDLRRSTTARVRALAEELVVDLEATKLQVDALSIENRQAWKEIGSIKVDYETARTEALRQHEWASGVTEKYQSLAKRFIFTRNIVSAVGGCFFFFLGLYAGVNSFGRTYSEWRWLGPLALAGGGAAIGVFLPIVLL